MSEEIPENNDWFQSIRDDIISDLNLIGRNIISQLNVMGLHLQKMVNPLLPLLQDKEVK
jgi:hypothetical protein